MYTIRPLQQDDYHCGFLQLLEQLTTVHASDITYEDFIEQFNKMKSNVFVIKDDNKIIATGSIFIEEKFIHKLSSVGHIEDVVVDVNYRSKGLGKMIIDHCIKFGKDGGCYKIILDCAQKNIQFYEKCGFENKNVQMSIYL
jgi:glucosamine-phosphate N-acetyltransferase